MEAVSDEHVESFHQDVSAMERRYQDRWTSDMLGDYLIGTLLEKLLSVFIREVSGIKAHAGYIGNEEADRLAKEAVETEIFPETPIEFPKSFIKTFLRQKMLATWQMAWDDGDTGSLIHNVIPKFSLQPINWTRTEVLLFTGHGPFPSFLQRFNLAEIALCSCGGIGTPIHFATVCLLTTSCHMTPPSQQYQPVWFRNVANISTSKRKIHNLLHFLQRETSLFRPDPN
ncbi:hypothetical protein AVEN_190139-1 [Araneus ventricosus]|uniref:Uncharacterized protein n=1 Tax=Araneus ventricosus TaxID=182803 RepID=A0A4Y2N9V3_ARAVE|nr:hypothetical protein AVEN_190139-1 [Araneus ventricosus]